MKKILLAGMWWMVAVSVGWAFPSAEEFAAAQQVVRSMLAEDLVAVSAGKTELTAAARKCETLSEQTRVKAEQLLYQQAAIILYARAGRYQRASELIMALARAGEISEQQWRSFSRQEELIPKLDDPILDIAAIEPDETLRLNGEQVPEKMELKEGAEYLVDGNYTVQTWQTLVVPKGTMLRFEADCGIVVEGTIKVIGSELKPVVMRGKGNAKGGSWRGVKLQRGSHGEFAWARWMAADTAINVVGAEAQIRNCEFIGNNCGLEVEGESVKGLSSVDNSLFRRNGDAIRVNSAKFTVTRCMLVDNDNGLSAGADNLNARWKFDRYHTYAQVEVDKTLFLRNEYGVYANLFAEKVKVCGCAFVDNRQDVLSEASKINDYTGNWWGATNTVGLVKFGEGWRGGGFKGERLDVSGYLKKYPSGVGCDLSK